MPSRSPQAEIDLIIAEYEALLANNPFSNGWVTHETAGQSDNLIRRLETLLGDDLEHLVTSTSDIEDVSAYGNRGHSMVKIERFRSKAEAALSYAKSAKNRPGTVTDERAEVLATLVAAYLKDRSPILARSGGDKTTIFHPGVPRDYAPNWSHVQALASDGLLTLYPESTRGDYEIGIPTGVINDYERGDPFAVSIAGTDRGIEALQRSSVTNFYMTTTVHGNASIVGSGSDVKQRIVNKQITFDVASLIAQLRDAGVDDERLADLETTVNEAEDSKKAALRWLGGFVTDVTSGAVGGAVAANLPTILTLMAAIANGVF